MSAFVLDIHFLTDPFGVVTLVFFVPETSVVWDIGVFPAALELLAVWAIFVDGSFVSSSSAVARTAAVPSPAAAVIV